MLCSGHVLGLAHSQRLVLVALSPLMTHLLDLLGPLLLGPFFFLSTYSIFSSSPSFSSLFVSSIYGIRDLLFDGAQTEIETETETDMDTETNHGDDNVLPMIDGDQ